MADNVVCAEGFGWITPYLTVKDVEAAMSFYQKAFWFEKKDAVRSPEGDYQYGEMSYHNQIIMFGKEGLNGSAALSPQTNGELCPVSFYLYCKDVDSFHISAVAAGAQSLVLPRDMFWGDRLCKLQCPDGYVWAFATNKKKKQ